MKYPSEEWKIIKDFPDYAVSSYGRVMRINKGANNTRVGKILCSSSVPYRAVNLYRNKKRRRAWIHQLVAIAFLGPYPPGKEVNHKNGNKTDNRKDNLEYVTHLENQRHAIEKYRRGSSNGNAKLTKDDVQKILKLRKEGWTEKKMAEMFNVSASGIHDILAGNSWTWLTKIKRNSSLERKKLL